MTLLRCALFCLLATLGLPAAAQETEVGCRVAAEVADKDPKGLNIRGGPGAKFPVVAVISAMAGVVVEISGSSGAWMRVKSTADGNEEKDFSRQQAWVYGPLLSFDLWARHPAKSVPMRAAPDAQAPVLATLPVDKVAAVTGCKGQWIKARVEGKEGWFAPEHRCANPFTECN